MKPYILLKNPSTSFVRNIYPTAARNRPERVLESAFWFFKKRWGKSNPTYKVHFPVDRKINILYSKTNWFIKKMLVNVKFLRWFDTKTILSKIKTKLISTQLKKKYWDLAPNVVISKILTYEGWNVYTNCNCRKSYF